MTALRIAAALLLLWAAREAWRCARYWWIAAPKAEVAKAARARAARRLA